MEMISTTQLAAVCTHGGSRIGTFVQPLNDAMSRFAIMTPRRQAAFLAQCAHESGEFRWLRELASGEVYDGRVALGNSQPGDGPRFKGGGCIQITGRSNFTACGAAIDVDLANHPELIEQPQNACMASAWWWQSHGLNELADDNAFGTITKRINGGYTHLDERLQYWLLALKATGAL